MQQAPSLKLNMPYTVPGSYDSRVSTWPGGMVNQSAQVGAWVSWAGSDYLVTLPRPYLPERYRGL